MDGAANFDDEMNRDPDQPELDLDDMHESNPFLPGFRPHTRRRRVAIGGEKIGTINLETGVIDGTAELTKTVTVDREEFVKIFQAQIGVFFSLTQPGIKVLSALWAEMGKKPGADQVYMTFKLADQIARRHGGKISRATFYRGRSDLIEKGFIAGSQFEHIYWVNPAIFFNGDRLKLVQEIVRPPEIVGPGESFAGETGGDE